jgi:putative membrane protein
MNVILLINSLIYSVLGLVVFCVGFALIDKLTPYNLWEELVKEKNIALAIVVGSVSIGLCLIIAAAVHG